MRHADILQHFDLGSVAVHHRVADLAAGADAVRVDVECDVLEAGLFQYARDVLPNPAEAADHHVLPFRGGQGDAFVTHGLGLRVAGLAQNNACDAPIVDR